MTHCNRFGPSYLDRVAKIRDLLKCKSVHALSKVNNFKGLISCQIWTAQCLFKEYTLSLVIPFLKEIEISLILMDFSLYLVQVLTCTVTSRGLLHSVSFISNGLTEELVDIFQIFMAVA